MNTKDVFYYIFRLICIFIPDFADIKIDFIASSHATRLEFEAIIHNLAKASKQILPKPAFRIRKKNPITCCESQNNSWKSYLKKMPFSKREWKWRKNQLNVSFVFLFFALCFPLFFAQIGIRIGVDFYLMRTPCKATCLHKWSSMLENVLNYKIVENGDRV